MTELAKQFQSNLDNIFGEKRVKVRIIHDDRDICINSGEREILYAVQEQQQSTHNLHWSFSEKFRTKALTISFKENPVPHFQGIAEIYKKYFSERIQLIINNCDEMGIEHNKQVSEYETVKRLYKSILIQDRVNYEQYRKIREMFEHIRYLQQC